MQPQPVGDIRSNNSNLDSTSLSGVESSLNPITGDEGNIRPSRGVSPEPGGSAITGGQYSGPTSSYTFLRRAWKRFSHGDRQATGLANGVTDDSASTEDTSIFAFGDRSAPQVDVEAFRLPDRATGTRLLSQYFELAMPTYRFFHQQTVEEWLETYYQQEDAGNNQKTLTPVRQVSTCPNHDGDQS